MTLSRLRIQKCLVRPVPWTEDSRDRYPGLTLFVSVGTLITIWAAESIAMHWWAFACVAFKNCLWTVMLLILRSHMSAMCRARCLGCAVFANICKDRPGTICNSQWPQPQAVRGRSRGRSWRHSLRPVLPWWWWHWDLIVSRSPGYRPRCPPPPVCLSVLSSFTPDHHRLRLRDVLRVPRPGLAWAGECTRTRSVTESEMKWYNTQVAEYFINPLRPQAFLSETKQSYWT